MRKRATSPSTAKARVEVEKPEHDVDCDQRSRSMPPCVVGLEPTQGNRVVTLEHGAWKVLELVNDVDGSQRSRGVVVKRMNV